MRIFVCQIRDARASALRMAPLALAMLLLAGCETTGSGPGTPATAKPAEAPMTHSRAAQECWMATEKGYASADLDKRADLVTKCIDDKMKGAPPAPRS